MQGRPLITTYITLMQPELTSQLGPPRHHLDTSLFCRMPWFTNIYRSDL